VNLFLLEADHSSFFEDRACLSDHWSRHHSVKIMNSITQDVLRPPYRNHNKWLTNKQGCQTCLAVSTTNIQRRAALKSTLDSIRWDVLALIEDPCYWIGVISASESLGTLLCIMEPVASRPGLRLFLEKTGVSDLCQDMMDTKYTSSCFLLC